MRWTDTVLFSGCLASRRGRSDGLAPVSETWLPADSLFCNAHKEDYADAQIPHFAACLGLVFIGKYNTSNKGFKLDTSLCSARQKNSSLKRLSTFHCFCPFVDPRLQFQTVSKKNNTLKVGTGVSVLAGSRLRREVQKAKGTLVFSSDSSIGALAPPSCAGRKGPLREPWLRGRSNLAAAYTSHMKEALDRVIMIHDSDFMQHRAFILITAGHGKKV